MTSAELLLPAAVLKRKAVVYVRQSTQAQVQTNLESQRRQYDLVEVARHRGFRDVEVIDDDLGRSASGMNFSRTCWITFHCRGITSRVSVTSSLSFVSLDHPQQGHALGPGTTTRSRARCSGKGLRTVSIRGKPRDNHVPA
jgi:hypothetical protein